MCPFCTATLLGIAAGTVTTGGVATLFAFTRRLARDIESATPVDQENPRP